MIAEKSVLGTLLKEPYLLAESSLRPEHFAEATHKNIFQAMRELQEDGKPVDLVTVLTFKNPKDLGGANYLSDLQNYANEKKYEEHEETVLELWREREKRNIVQQAMTEDWDIDTLTAKLGALRSNRVDDHSTIADLLAEVYEAPFIEQEVQDGITSGVKALDAATYGWQDTDLIILAARPSMGKTDVMLKLAMEAGWTGSLPLIFSLEMSAKKLRDRMIPSAGRFNRGKMRNPYKLMTDGQKDDWSRSIGKVAATKIEIFERSGQTVPEIRMKMRKAIQRNPERKPIVFIDYLTLIKPVNGTGNKHQDVGDITKGLKGIAKEFNCPVIVLAQLSRSVEQRQDKRPVLSDLRESGSIEEDADVVAFLYRDSYYNPEAEDQTLEINIAKNRNGETGKIVVAYNQYTGSVDDLAVYQNTVV